MAQSVRSGQRGGLLLRDSGTERPLQAGLGEHARTTCMRCIFPAFWIVVAVFKLALTQAERAIIQPLLSSIIVAPYAKEAPLCCSYCSDHGCSQLLVFRMPIHWRRWRWGSRRHNYIRNRLSHRNLLNGVQSADEPLLWRASGNIALRMT